MADTFTIGLTFLAAILVIGLPSVLSITYATCKGGYVNRYCTNYFSTKCCSSLIFSSAYCCSPTRCYSSFQYNSCLAYTDSTCCRWSIGGSSSCCNYYQYSRTSSMSRTSSSSSFWSKYSSTSSYDYGSVSYLPIGAIIGGVIGGIVFLVLIIVIPVVACGVCAAAGSNRRGGRMQTTTVVTQNQIQANRQVQGAYVNQGYAPPAYGQVAMVPPPGGAPPPPSYGQAVQFTGQSQAGAPPGLAMYPPQPGGPYPPPPAGQYPPPDPNMRY